MPDDVGRLAKRVGPLIDSNVHLWDQDLNPVFWLTDRTMLRDMLGNYDALPGVYTLDDHLDVISAFDARGIVWSDAGAADPVAAARWVSEQDATDAVVGIVSLGDPTDPNFGELVRELRSIPLVTSVRVRLVADLATPDSTDSAPAGHDLLDALALLGDLGLVATIEAGADQLGQVTDIAHRLGGLHIVVDHFGWPTDFSPDGRRAHLDALRALADAGAATRIDAIGTIFGNWETETLRPWLTGVVDVFGPERCMLGSDLPIETLRSTFARLYGAYDAIFDGYSDDDRRLLFGEAARQMYAMSAT